MIRISRLTDYGLVLLTFMAAQPDHPLSASELSQGTELPLPTVSKLLQLLTRGRLLQSQRGVKGGYILAQPPSEVSVAAIVTALEGPVALTLCTVDPAGDCEYEGRCRIRGHLFKINVSIRNALESITLADMAATPLTANDGLAATNGAPEANPV